MSEEVKQEQAEQAQATQEQEAAQDAENQAQEKTVDEKIKEALAEQEKKWKNQISGLDQKNNELAKKLKEAEREKLSEEERIKAELQEARSEKERMEQEASQFRRQLEIEKAVHKYKLPDRFADRIKGETAEEIEADAKGIADFFSQEIQRQASEAVNQKLSGKPPKGGESVDTSSFQAQYDNAAKQNDVAAMISISQRAAQAGEEIKQY